MLGPISVSVIIPTKNRETETIDCVRSVLLQSYLPTEIIVIDQGDVDELEGKLRLLCDEASVILVYEWERGLSGLAGARNYGFARSSGSIVLFLDDDVVLEQDYIREVVEIYASDRDLRVGGVGGWIVNSAAGESWFKRWFLVGIFRDQRDNFRAKPADRAYTNALSGCNMSFRCNVYAHFKADEWLKGYSMGEDWDLSNRIASEYQLIMTSRAKLRHHASPEGRLPSATRRRMYIRNMHHFYRVRRGGSLMDRTAQLLTLMWFWIGLALQAANYARHGHSDVSIAILRSLVGEMLCQLHLAKCDESGSGPVPGRLLRIVPIDRLIGDGRANYGRRASD